MERTRRSVLATLGATLTVFGAGCRSTPGDDPATAPDTSEPRPDSPTSESRPDSPTSERRPPSSTGSPAWTAPSTPTETPGLDAADVLPEPGGEWRVESKGGLQVRYIGGETGANAEYTSPDGVRFRVVVVEREDPSSAEVKAHGLYCDGWPVTLAHEEFAFAAGSGTVQPTDTYTPETPPHMTRSPVPETTDRAVELLTSSPILTAAIVSNRTRSCDWESGVQ